MKRLDENAIVAKIMEAFPRRRARVGIGDDAAVLDFGPGTVVTSDALVEAIDFTRDIPVPFIAAKSLSVNLSDLASMGAMPHSFTVTLAAPEWLLEEIDGFVAGLADAARTQDLELVGGDLSSSSLAFISITAFGHLAGRPLLRSQARPGDRLFVSRPIGGSAAGLLLLQRGWRMSRTGSVVVPENISPSYEQRAFAEAAIRQHVDPQAESDLGPRLAELEQVHACIDVSDGLSTDLRRMCDASSVGAIVEWERIPAFDGLDTTGRTLVDPDRAALHGGEELALLFAADARESELSTKLGRPVFQVGRVTKDAGEILLERDGRTSTLHAEGYDHFRGSRQA